MPPFSKARCSSAVVLVTAGHIHLHFKGWGKKVKSGEMAGGRRAGIVLVRGVGGGGLVMTVWLWQRSEEARQTFQSPSFALSLSLSLSPILFLSLPDSFSLSVSLLFLQLSVWL